MKIFQTSSLFETNKFHHEGPPFSGGPGAIAPVAPPLIRPCSQCKRFYCESVLPTKGWPFWEPCFVNLFHDNWRQAEAWI